MLRCVFLYYLLAPLIFVSDRLALPPCHASSWQHFTFPFVHANLLHWFLNGVAILSLSTILRWQRTAWAYVFSVMVGFLHEPMARMGLSPSLPLLGFSVIVYFYMGMLYVHLPSWRRWRIVIVAAAGLFVPGIAALVHIMMLVTGATSEIIRSHWTRYES